MIEVVKNINFKNCENKIYEWFDREIAEKLSIRDNFFKIQIKPSQRGLGNLQRGKKWRPKNNQAEEKTVSWGETVRKNS